MSFITRPVRKVTWCLPFYGRRHALRLSHLVLYSTLIGIALLLYTWPGPSLEPQSKANIREFSCTGSHGCTEKGRDEKDSAPPAARITQAVGINVTTKAPPPKEEEHRLEPKNWNGQGYMPVSSEKRPLRHCQQCALVTSSGHLSGKGMGKAIDNSECVIRMNAAPTLNYTHDVGSRTTFRVIGHRNFPRMFDTEEERKLYFVNTTTKSEAIVVLWLYSVNVNRNLELILSRKFAQKYKDVEFYLTKQEIMNRNVELFYQELGTSKTKGRLWMSTGWVAMLFALEVCDNIDVYGMIYDDYCKENPNDETYYHYFDKLQTECKYYEKSEKRLTSGHKFMTEKVAFARWASMYNIHFHTPSWENHQYDPKIQKETVFQKAYMQYKERMSNKTNEDKSGSSLVRKPESGVRTNNKEEQNVPRDVGINPENGVRTNTKQVQGAPRDSGVKPDNVVRTNTKQEQGVPHYSGVKPDNGVRTNTKDEQDAPHDTGVKPESIKEMANVQREQAAPQDFGVNPEVGVRTNSKEVENVPHDTSGARIGGEKVGMVVRYKEDDDDGDERGRELDADLIEEHVSSESKV